MLAPSKGSASGAIFHQSPPNTGFGKVYSNNMDETSYVGKKEVELTLTNTQTAFFDTTGGIRTLPEYLDCQLEEVWTYKMGGFSIPHWRGLPYAKFMRQVIQEIINKGQLARIKEKWKVSKPDCSPVLRQGKPLTFEKLVSPFMIVGLACILALISLIFELLFHKISRTPPSEQFKDRLSECLKNIEKVSMTKLQDDKHLQLKIFNLVERIRIEVLGNETKIFSQNFQFITTSHEHLEKKIKQKENILKNVNRALSVKKQITPIQINDRQIQIEQTGHKVRLVSDSSSSSVTSNNSWKSFK